MIAIDQDSLGKQATPTKSGSIETWIKPLADGSMAVAIVNLAEVEATAGIKGSDLGLDNKMTAVRDLWAHTDVPFPGGVYSAKIPPHGALLLRVSTKN